MAKKNRYEHIGSGSYNVYRRKPAKSFGEKLGDFLGGLVLVFIVLAVIGAVAG